MRIALKDAIVWIAMNDNAGEEGDGPEDCANYVTTCLVADLFGKDQNDLGARIHKVRTEFKEKGEDAGALTKINTLVSVEVQGRREVRADSKYGKVMATFRGPGRKGKAKAFIEKHKPQ